LIATCCASANPKIHVVKEMTYGSRRLRWSSQTILRGQLGDDPAAGCQRKRYSRKGYEAKSAGTGWFGRVLDRIRPRGPAATAKAVRRWRNRLRNELGLTNLDWNEDPDTEYATDKPAWDCYGALVLWAAYEELSGAKRRETAEGWDKDPAYLTSRVNPHSRYRHLIADSEIWIPVEFGAPLRTTAIVGDNVVVASSIRLLAELRELKSRTWNADDQQISRWRFDGAEYGGPLEIRTPALHASLTARLQLPVWRESLTRPAGVKRFFHLFCLCESLGSSLLISIGHTHALAQERSFPGRILFRRRSLSVSPYALSPVFLHPFGTAHQTSLRS
jgi:hypothetical protein